MKNQKGITLIALVITIIVLLILAGVSIAMLTGQNGILTRATDAKNDTTNAEAVERINMALNAAYASAMGPEVVAPSVTNVTAQDSALSDITKYKVDNTTNSGCITITYVPDSRIYGTIETTGSYSIVAAKLPS